MKKYKRRCSIKILLSLILMLSASGFTESVKREKYSGQTEVFEDYIKELIFNILDGPDPTVEYLVQLDANNHYAGMMVVIKDLPCPPPYRLETRRLKQFDPNRYHTAHDQQFILNTMRQDGLKTPVALPMALTTYLPGERVFWRISTPEGKILKTIGCAPLPLILRNSENKVLMEASLASANRPTTVYFLWFPPRKESFDLIFHCGKSQKITIDAGGFYSDTFEPKIEGKTGGISTIEILSGGESYRIDLPWGTELEKHLKK